MKRERKKLVVLGLSLSSSWGNGHATTYRALLRACAAMGNEVLFLERDVPWYRDHRDPAPDYCRLAFYKDLSDLAAWHDTVRDADAVIVGSYVPDGTAVGRWVQETAQGVVAFYDIDTPVTLRMLESGRCPYLSEPLIRGYDLYLSFTGGPTLAQLERDYGAPMARAFYCSVDPEFYRPQLRRARWHLSYLGTYSDDRQPTLEKLLLSPARRAPHLRFCVAGAQYPTGIQWPANVERLEHVAPERHPAFYSESHFTLNVTRADMVRAGFSPSVRLFEAAGCAVPVISDRWAGLDRLFLPEQEIFIADAATEILEILQETPPARRLQVGHRARQRVLDGHTAAHRAGELIRHLDDAAAARRPIPPRLPVRAGA